MWNSLHSGLLACTYMFVRCPYSTVYSKVILRKGTPATIQNYSVRCEAATYHCSVIQMCLFCNQVILKCPKVGRACTCCWCCTGSSYCKHGAWLSFIVMVQVQDGARCSICVTTPRTEWKIMACVWSGHGILHEFCLSIRLQLAPWSQGNALWRKRDKMSPLKQKTDVQMILPSVKTTLFCVAFKPADLHVTQLHYTKAYRWTPRLQERQGLEEYGLSILARARQAMSNVFSDSLHKMITAHAGQRDLLKLSKLSITTYNWQHTICIR